MDGCVEERKDELTVLTQERSDILVEERMDTWKEAQRGGKAGRKDRRMKKTIDG